VRAARELHVTPSTVWAQVKAIEGRLGVRLLQKRGRRLVLTEAGERVARVADEIFALSQEVLAVTRGQRLRTTPSRIGVVTSVPRFVSGQLLRPLLARGRRLSLVHGTAAEMLGQLASGAVEAVLSDDSNTGEVKATSTLVATSELSLFCAPSLQATLVGAFPRSLDGAPFMLPMPGSTKRNVVDLALAQLGVRPDVVCEVDDSALMKALATEGRAVIAAPRLLHDELQGFFGLVELGSLETTVSYHLIALASSSRVVLGDLLTPRAG
jgi:LysR family transcriptional activator of nhaA